MPLSEADKKIRHQELQRNIEATNKRFQEEILKVASLRGMEEARAARIDKIASLGHRMKDQDELWKEVEAQLDKMSKPDMRSYETFGSAMSDVLELYILMGKALGADAEIFFGMMGYDVKEAITNTLGFKYKKEFEVIQSFLEKKGYTPEIFQKLYALLKDKPYLSTKLLEDFTAQSYIDAGGVFQTKCDYAFPLFSPDEAKGFNERMNELNMDLMESFLLERGYEKNAMGQFEDDSGTILDNAEFTRLKDTGFQRYAEKYNVSFSQKLSDDPSPLTPAP